MSSKPVRYWDPDELPEPGMTPTDLPAARREAAVAPDSAGGQPAVLAAMAAAVAADQRSRASLEAYEAAEREFRDAKRAAGDAWNQFQAALEQYRAGN